jgi:peptidyl-prolyl cis-trans isomerase B (cyclophilin B)
MRFESYQRKKDEAGMAQLRGEVETEVGKISDSMYNAIPGRVKQMYGTWGGSPFLDKNYTVFGFLVSGYDVLEKLNKVETLGDKAGNRPVADVKIISARVMN